VFRRHWMTGTFWHWWWRTRVPVGAKLATLITLVFLVLVGGYFASAELTGASAAGGSSQAYVLEKTMTRVVTVRHRGTTVTIREPTAVRRDIVRQPTALETVVETRYVPVVRRSIVRPREKTQTVVETRLVPTVRTRTVTNAQTLTLTTTQTVTNEDTVVVTSTVERRPAKPPPLVTVTVTQTLPVTVTETTTVTTPAPPKKKH
jgi:hypothetical protein